MSRILLSLLLASPLALSSNTFQGPCIPVETCLNIVDMHYNEAGTVPAGDFLLITPMKDENGTSSSIEHCDREHTCQTCITEISVDFGGTNGNSLQTRSCAEHSPCPPWTQIRYVLGLVITLRPACGEQQYTEFAIEDSSGVQLFYRAVKADCTC